MHGDFFLSCMEIHTLFRFYGHSHITIVRYIKIRRYIYGFTASWLDIVFNWLRLKMRHHLLLHFPNCTFQLLNGLSDHLPARRDLELIKSLSTPDLVTKGLLWSGALFFSFLFMEAIAQIKHCILTTASWRLALNEAFMISFHCLQSNPF